MSIIYDALQKTQRNREYLKFQRAAMEQQPPRRFLKKIAATLLILTSLGTAAGIYFYQITQHPQRKSLPHPIAEKPRSLESEHLWVTTNDKPKQNTETRLVAATPIPTAFTLNGVLITGQDKVALINNQSFRMGDIVGGMKIVSIEFNQVKLQKDQNIIELRVPV